MPSHVGRRTLLGAGAALAVSGCGDASRADDGADGTRIRYAHDHRDQYAVLGRPRGRVRGLVVLLHGGFWQAAYGAGLMEPMGADLRRRGLATWNVEYRRVGDGGGWPATFVDVARAVDHVRTLGSLARVPLVLVGHSAGGQLAVWAASRAAGTPGGTPRVPPVATVSLSGVLDLSTAALEEIGGSAVTALMGAGPRTAPERYAAADPALRVPAHGPVVAVHALDDVVVPLAQSRRYVDAALRAGGQATLFTVPGGHFGLIDPTSPAWPTIRRTVTAAAVATGTPH